MFYVVAGIAAAGILFGLLLVLGAYYAYRRVFFAPERTEPPTDYRIPDTEQYRPYRKEILELLDAALQMPYESVTVQSEDGLKLFGKYYHCKDGAPLQIMFHGYRTPLAERDFEGGMQIAKTLGHNILLVDQRGHGKSQGHVTTFGIRERKDCLVWIRYANQRFGEDTRILLFGISMGAATVLMASGLLLPSNVSGIVADCGYTSPEAIIRFVIRDMGLPEGTYGIVKLGAKLFAKLDISEAVSAKEAMKTCQIPVLFIHGEGDTYVPWDMSRENYAQCSCEKYFFTVPGAGHGMSFFGDRKGYVDAIRTFSTGVCKEYTGEKKNMIFKSEKR